MACCLLFGLLGSACITIGPQTIDPFFQGLLDSLWKVRFEFQVWVVALAFKVQALAATQSPIIESSRANQGTVDGLLFLSP